MAAVTTRTRDARVSGSSARTGSAGLVGEVALTGAPAARRLYREIAADPQASLLLEVVGVGGAGKSVLLNVLARLYTESGIAVSHDPGEPVGSQTTLLVDDAQLLNQRTVHGLAEAVRSGSLRRLLIARRPLPRSAELAELGALLAQRRAPVVLADLDRAGVAGRAALALGTRPPAELVDAVLEQTAGLPALVTLLLDTLEETGELSATRPGDQPPAGVIDQLAYQLERLSEPVRRLALALAAGAPLDAEVLAPILELPADQVAQLTEQAVSAGLVTDQGALRPITARAALRTTPKVRLLAVRRRLAELQLDRGGSVLTAAVELLGSDATGARMAAVFCAAADEVLRAGAPPCFASGGVPPGDSVSARYDAQSEAARLASRLLDAAVVAGAPAVELAARRAEAAARASELDRALELTDQVLADPNAVSETDRVRAVNVAATVLAQRGLLARCAELYRWLGAASMGANAVVAVPPLLGIGALHEARELLEPNRDAPGCLPTLLAGAESLLARGVYDTIVGSPTAALSQLARAAALLEPTAATVLLPDTPAALATLVAAHCGELDVAQSVLDRAIATGLGGSLAAARHRLLQAWVLMTRGATVAAGSLLAEVDAGGRLEPRDELVAAALAVGLARRAGDLAALVPAWGRAREAIVRHPVDLYALQPLGELTVAAARLREQSWVRPHLDEAHELLRRLGDPVLWSASLHWAQLHAALTAEQWEEASRYASALERGATSGRYVAALAAGARCWLAVLRGEVDPAAAEAAARGLHAVGLSWEGSKLAGQAAIRTTDRKAMTELLSCARGLRPTGQPAVSSAESSESTRAAPLTSLGGAQTPLAPAAISGALSDREREVAELMVTGLTYKQIGERLFISAKTVEHHVARMRQRLGSTSRPELIAHLRMIVNA